jgi:cytoskeletal protein RodZ
MGVNSNYLNNNIQKSSPSIAKLFSKSKSVKKSPIESEKGYQYLIYVVLGLIILILLGLLIYYVFFKKTPEIEPTPTSTPSITPTSSPSITPTSSPSSSPSSAPGCNCQSSLYPSPSPSPTCNCPQPTDISMDNLKIIKKQFKEMGNNYNTLPENTKKRARYCYKNPDECAF